MKLLIFFIAFFITLSSFGQGGTGQPQTTPVRFTGNFFVIGGDTFAIVTGVNYQQSDRMVLVVGDSLVGTVNIGNIGYVLMNWQALDAASSFSAGEEGFYNLLMNRTNTVISKTMGSYNGRVILGADRIMLEIVSIADSTHIASIELDTATGITIQANDTSRMQFDTNGDIILLNTPTGAGYVWTDLSGNGEMTLEPAPGSIWQIANDSTIIWINGIGDTAIIFNDPDNGLAFSRGISQGRFAIGGEADTIYEFGNNLAGVLMSANGEDFTFAESLLPENANEHDLGKSGQTWRYIYQSYSSSDVTNPPTDAELDAIFGTPATVGDGFTARVKDSNSNNFYIVIAVGSEWYTTGATLAP